MALMKLPENYEENTRNKLIEMKCPKMLLIIFNFAFLTMIQDLMQELDNEFKGKRGPKAYPRTLLLIVVLFCFSERINTYKGMTKECDKNKYLEVILMGKVPSRGTFANFLNKSNHDTIPRVFIATSVLLNDMNVLSIARVFIDGTDIIVRGSRRYFIKQKDLRAMNQLNEWGLIHDGSRERIKETLNELNIKLKEFEDDEEMVKLIKLAKRRIRIYKHSVYKNKNRYEKQFEKRGDVKLSIIFPKAVYLKTKKEIFDFAFNLQAVMTDKHLIFTSILLAQSNDHKAFKDVYYQIKHTLCEFIEMQWLYGERKNFPFFINAFLNIIIVADAGYFTVKNLYFIFIKRINALVIPNTEARKVNDKLRARDGDEEKELSIKDKYFKRVKGRYECLNNGFLKFKEVIPIKHRKPQNNNLPDVCKTKRQIYKKKHCEGCPYFDECPRKVEDRIPFLFRWMTEKFLDLRHRVHYPLRFSRSEGVNGFHKNQEGIVKFVGTTLNAVNNELDFRDIVYNLTRIETLKEEGF